MLFRKILFNILYYSGCGHILFFLNQKSGKVPIILFHRVSPIPDPCWPPLTPIQFEKTIILLSKHYEFLPLDSLLEKNRQLKRNACSIVFDDGFLDFKEYAFPILIKHKVPVTLFVPTDNINNQKPIWTSEVDAIILHANKNIRKIFIEEKEVKLMKNTDKELFSTAANVKNILMPLSPSKRNIAIKKIRKTLTNGKEKNHPMLNWNDIQKIKEEAPNLIDIQSHTHTHPFLPSLNSDELINEMKDSLEILNSKHLNKCNKVAYPIGAYNNGIKLIAKKHYTFGFRVGDIHHSIKKLNTPDYAFEIPRFNIHTSNPKETFFFINGFHTFFRRKYSWK